MKENNKFSYWKMGTSVKTYLEELILLIKNSQNRVCLVETNSAADQPYLLKNDLSNYRSDKVSKYTQEAKSWSTMRQILDYAKYFSFLEINSLKKPQNEQICWNIGSIFSGQNNNVAKITYNVFLKRLSSIAFWEFLDDDEKGKMPQEIKITLSILKSFHYFDKNLINATKYNSLYEYFYNQEDVEDTYRKTYKDLIEIYWKGQDFSRIKEIFESKNSTSHAFDKKLKALYTKTKEANKLLDTLEVSSQNFFPQSKPLNTSELLKKLQSLEVKVPLFQRNYEWPTRLVQNLMDDIINFKFQEKEQYIFLGTISTLRQEKTNVYELIDGQQRIVTVLLILKAAYLELLSNYSLFQDFSKKETFSELKDFFSQLGKNEAVFLNRVASYEKEEELQNFLQEDNWEKLKNKYEGKKNNLFLQFFFLKNYLEAKAKSITKSATPEHYSLFIENIIETSLHKVAFVLNIHYGLNGSEMFEKMNQDYIKLSDKTLLKNYLFSGIFSYKEKNERYFIKIFDDLFDAVESDGKSKESKNFANFFKTLLRMLGEEYKDSDSFVSIKNYLNKFFTNYSLLDALDTMQRSYKVYKNLFLLKHFTYSAAENSKSKSPYTFRNIVDYLNLLNKKDVFWPIIWRIYALGRYKKFEDLSFNTQELRKRRLLLHYFLTYWTKYLFIKGKEDSFTTRIAGLIQQINDVQNINEREFLSFEMWNKSLQKIFYSTNFDSFETKLTEEALATSEEHKYLCLILENFAAYDLNKAILDFEDERISKSLKIFKYDLEHIVPQTKDNGDWWSQWFNTQTSKYKETLYESDSNNYAKIVNMLGNSLLLPNKLNIKIKRKKYQEKIRALESYDNQEIINSALYSGKNSAIIEISESIARENGIKATFSLSKEVSKYVIHDSDQFDYEKIYLRSKTIARFLDLKILGIDFLNDLQKGLSFDISEVELHKGATNF